MDVFTNPEDGDHHVHILIDEKYRDLIKVKFVLFPYAEMLRIMSVILPVLIAISYVIVSIVSQDILLLEDTSQVLSVRE
jgi:hypothetical protein